MKFDHSKHDVEKFAYDLRVLGKMIGITDKQVLKHSREAFPPKFESQLLEEDYTDVAMGNMRLHVGGCFSFFFFISIYKLKKVLFFL